MEMDWTGEIEEDKTCLREISYFNIPNNAERCNASHWQDQPLNNVGLITSMENHKRRSVLLRSPLRFGSESKCTLLWRPFVLFNLMCGLDLIYFDVLLVCIFSY